MAVWRKVIVSGSQAELATLKVDNLINGVVTGSSNGTLSIVPINGTGAIVASTGSSGLSMSGSFSGSFQGIGSGSFSGSFFGNGSGLTGIQATSLANSLNAGLGLSGSTFSGNAPATFSISGSAQLTSNFHTKWTGTGLGNGLIFDDGTNLQITGSTIIVSGASTAFIVTGSVRASAGFTGSLFGTASWASNATSALTASYLNNLNQNLSITGSLILSGSTGVELIVLGETQFTGSVSSAGGFTGSLFGTSSWASQVQTASFVTASNVWGPFGSNSIVSSSYALTASYAANGGTLINSLFAGLGLSGSSFNGGAPATFSISGSAQLTGTKIPKWTGTGFNDSNITDTGTLITLGTSIVNVSIPGNLTVAGTASFTNTDSLFVADQFIALASGSNWSSTPKQSGIIGVVGSTTTGMSGSAFLLDTVGTHGRWAFTASLNSTASSTTVSEYVVSVAVNQVGAPSSTTNKPTWGSDTNNTNQGNMWITAGGDIYIYV